MAGPYRVESAATCGRRRNTDPAAHLLPSADRGRSPTATSTRSQGYLELYERCDRRLSVRRVQRRVEPDADRLRHADAHLSRRRRAAPAVHPRDLARPRGAAQLVGQRRLSGLRARQLVRGSHHVHGRLRVQGARGRRGGARDAPRLAARLCRAAARRGPRRCARSPRARTARRRSSATTRRRWCSSCCATTIGAEAFDAGLRRFWIAHRFKVASWSDLQRAFESTHGASLEPFFAQWLTRAGAPQLAIAAAEATRRGAGYRVRVVLAQGSPPYRVRVPLALRTASGNLTHTVDLEGAQQSFTIDVDERPLAVALDPDLRLFRRLAADEAPPILRGLIVDPATALVVVSPALADAAQSLAARLLDHPPRMHAADQPPATTPLLVVGLRADIDAWLARTGVAARPPQAEKGDTQVWMAARAKAGAVGLVSVRDAAALAALERPLPHYGRQSWLVLEGGRVIERGTWPAKPLERRLD